MMQVIKVMQVGRVKKVENVKKVTELNKVKNVKNAMYACITVRLGVIVSPPSPIQSQKESFV